MNEDIKDDLLFQEIINRDNSISFNPRIFAQQEAFINDPAKFKSALCSRRAGKSTTAGIYLLKVARQFPDSRVHYLGLTRKSAKNILWKELKKLNKDHQLDIKFNNTDLIAELSNGSEIFLIGGNDAGAIETIRGMKSRLIIVDEAASYRSHLKYLLEEVLTPMLIDYDGTLCMLGTPSAACEGPFFDATEGKDISYSRHRWTILDNPFIPHASRWLEGYRKQKSWDLLNPIYLREWCGKWIKSYDSIVYKYVPQKNDLLEKTPGKYNHLIGVDIGYGDATAITVGAYKDYDPSFYVIETFKKTEMTVDEIMEKLSGFITQYNPDKVVMDSGGGGKLVAESFRKRYAIPIKPAQKKDKRDFIEQMNSDFLSGRIKVLPGNTALTDEWQSIQWHADKKNLEDPRYLNDLADSCLYTWRESTHYTERPQEEPPPRASEAWYQREIAIMEQQAEEEYRRQKQEEDEANAMFVNYADE